MRVRCVSRTAKRIERLLEQRNDRRHALGLDDHVPERLELLPAAGVEHMADCRTCHLLAACAADDLRPAVKVLVCTPVAVNELGWRHRAWRVDDVARAVE